MSASHHKAVATTHNLPNEVMSVVGARAGIAAEVGHSRYSPETVRYLGIEMDDAIEIAEEVDILSPPTGLLLLAGR